jgi:hypothetical protein
MTSTKMDEQLLQGHSFTTGLFPVICEHNVPNLSETNATEPSHYHYFHQSRFLAHWRTFDTAVHSTVQILLG